MQMYRVVLKTKRGNANRPSLICSSIMGAIIYFLMSKWMTQFMYWWASEWLS